VPVSAAPLVISGATIIDGVAEAPLSGHSLWIENGRIKALARPAELGDGGEGLPANGHAQGRNT
jgi:hypothetical protein